MVDSSYWIWLQLLFGIGTRRAELFMDYFANPLEIYTSIQEKSRALGMLDEIELKSWELAMEKAHHIAKRSRGKNITMLTPDHPQYPPLLQNIYSKPAVLYLRGDFCCLENRLTIAMVGTRTHTDYGKSAAQMLATGLASHGVVIVSGLAKGIDTICHQAALDANGVTVGILGCGLDIDYPKGSAPLKRDICKKGAVVTEYPLGTLPIPSNFPLRNRVLSGLSNGCVVVEADIKSGSLITAAHALEQGRDIFAVPGSIFSARERGTHNLIKDGAKLIECAEDVLEEYGIAFDAPVKNKTLAAVNISSNTRTNIIEDAVTNTQPNSVVASLEKTLPKALSDDGMRLVKALSSSPIGVEALGDICELDIAALQTALTELEIYGLIKVYPGRMFALI